MYQNSRHIYFIILYLHHFTQEIVSGFSVVILQEQGFMQTRGNLIQRKRELKKTKTRQSKRQSKATTALTHSLSLLPPSIPRRCFPFTLLSFFTKFASFRANRQSHDRVGSVLAANRNDTHGNCRRSDHEHRSNCQANGGCVGARGTGSRALVADQVLGGTRSRLGAHTHGCKLGRKLHKKKKKKNRGGGIIWGKNTTTKT